MTNDAAVVVDLCERRHRRTASYEAAFPSVAERALITLHLFIPAELDPHAAERWADYHVDAEHDLVDDLQNRYDAWQTAFFAAEAALRDGVTL